MKKTILFVPILFCFCLVQSQTQNKWSFTVEYYPKVINVTHGYSKIIFSLENNASHESFAPQNTILIPYTSDINFADILFEICYINGCDTSDITKYVKINIGQGKEKYATVKLSEDKKYIFEPDTGIPNEYFFEPGVYRIRFFFKKEKLMPKPIENLYTDWITIKKE